MSLLIIYIGNAPTTPVGVTRDGTLQLQKNRPANITCKLAKRPGDYMYMCLVPGGIDGADVARNFTAFATDNCVWCETDYCPQQLPIRPDWSFSDERNYSSPCGQLYVMTAVVPNVTGGDDGMNLVCAWADDTTESVFPYATVRLNVTEPQSGGGGGGGGVRLWPIVAGSIGGALLLGLVAVVATVAISAAVFRHKIQARLARRHLRRELRRQRLNNQIGESTYTNNLL